MHILTRGVINYEDIYKTWKSELDHRSWLQGNQYFCFRVLWSVFALHKKNSSSAIYLSVIGVRYNLEHIFILWKRLKNNAFQIDHSVICFTGDCVLFPTISHQRKYYVLMYVLRIDTAELYFFQSNFRWTDVST